MLLAILTGSLYPDSNLDEALKKIFGLDTPLLHHLLPGNLRGAKVVVTVSEKSMGDKELKSRIISTFASSSRQKRYLPYRDICLEPSKKKIKLWEAGRCTSSAPWLARLTVLRYFPLYHIEPTGSAYFDGGMWRNNPVDVAKREAKNLWPDFQEADLVLTLGTGYSGEEEQDTLHAPSPSLDPTRGCRARMGQQVWNCVKDIFNSYSNSLVMDGHKFHSLVGYMSMNRARPYCRLDTELSGPVPALDDVESMNRLMALTGEQCGAKVQAIAQSCIANLFYVELSQTPLRDGDGFWAEGYILCNIDQGESLTSLIKTLASEGYKFQVGRDMMPIMRRGCVGMVDQDFQVCFTVKTRTMDSPFSILLCAPNGIGRPISASPFTLSGLLNTQERDGMLHFNKARPPGRVRDSLYLDGQWDKMQWHLGGFI
ncbi:hypothetical protein FDECE_98 [Fusarium decemcellulare]|nr:hypothetical protein FDECE_98 [Fusarium decemcellulare]